MAHDLAGLRASPNDSAAGLLTMGSDRTLDNTGYCLLSLDGGGVRGLSTLYILQRIMERLNFEREEAGLRPKKPCEIFDLIGGTSTGGLIAIMLGRLEMTVEECIEEYTRLMRDVFEKRENRSIMGVFGKVKPRFSSKALQDAIAGVLRRRRIPLDEKFETGSKPSCKVFVCTKFQKTNTITRLRNYRNPSTTGRRVTIMQAALATSAAPTYFSPMAIEGIEFVDGAIGANNPAVEVEEEAADLWCENDANLKPLIKCFISVGTGHPGIRSVSDKGLKGLAETLVKEATETEPTSQRWLGRWRAHVGGGRAFRFNVRHGLENVRLAEFDEQETIEAATSTYLEEQGTKVEVKKCVENLRMKEFKPTPEFARKLNELALQTIEAKQPKPPLRATASEIAELIQSGAAHLKKPPNSITRLDLKRALEYYSRALQFLRNEPTTTSKQVARVCQKLTETSLMLSIAARDPREQKTACDQARNYGEAALDNVLSSGDACMVAQVEFLIACVSTWKMFLQSRMSGTDIRSHPRRTAMENEMEERLGGLRRFPNLDMEGYEAQAAKYLGYLDRIPHR